MGGAAIFLHMVVKRKENVEVLSVPPLFFDCWHQGAEVLGQPRLLTLSVLLKQLRLPCLGWQPLTTVFG